MLGAILRTIITCDLCRGIYERSRS